VDETDPVFLLMAVTGQGTGYERRELWMLMGRANGIAKAWDIMVYERDQSMPSQGGTVLRRDINFSADGDTLTVTSHTQRLASTDGGNTWKVSYSAHLPRQRFCRSSPGISFQPCA
jgi:hypothetical protein